MLKSVKLIISGIVFGILLSKSEMISWYRWQEMFLFDGFHLYGVMISTAFFGMLWIQLIKKYQLRDIDNNPIFIPDKDPGFFRYAIGGLIFGFGWTISGCPGVTYVLIGHGYFIWIIILISALLGTLLYGMFKKYLPH